MSARRAKRSFFLVLVDDDQKTFNVVGPMTDDTAWNHKIVSLQEGGRQVRCFSTETTRTMEEIAARYARQTGFAYSEKLVAEPPTVNSSTYHGSLPVYAARANRKRVVQLLCKGRCGTTRWAEMRVDYPGEDVLRSAQVGDFTATCLKCGDTASDPYNWYR